MGALPCLAGQGLPPALLQPPLPHCFPSPSSSRSCLNHCFPLVLAREQPRSQPVLPSPCTRMRKAGSDEPRARRASGARWPRWIRDAGTSCGPSGTGGVADPAVFLPSLSLAVICELCPRFPTAGEVCKSLRLCLPSAGDGGALGRDRAAVPAQEPCAVERGGMSSFPPFCQIWLKSARRLKSYCCRRVARYRQAWTARPHAMHFIRTLS